MATLQPTTCHDCACTPAESVRPQWWTVLASQFAAAAVYVAAVPLGGIDLSARSGDSTITIDFSLVMGVSLVVGIVALLWLVALRRLTARPNRNWAISAVVVLVISIAGPLGATNVAAGVTLAGMHLAFAGALAAGSLPLHRARLA